MPDQIKTEAIVLKKRKLPQQDIVITLFTRELGKVTTYAKGIKKITSRRAPHIQTANLVNVILTQNQERFFLDQTSLISGFTQLKEDPEKVNFVYLFFFILDRLLPDAEPEIRLYTLVKRFLVDISKTEKFTTQDISDYLQDTLVILGYADEKKPFFEQIRIIEDIIHERIPLHIS
jgi:DNA repair protein RecO (recombination protein O)